MNLLDSMARHFFAPFYRYVKKDFSHKYFNDVLNHNLKSSDEMKDFQLQRITEIYKSAKDTPFYSNSFQEAGLGEDFALKSWDDFERLPVLSKDDFRRNSDNLVGNGVNKDQLKKSATGGTTSAPASFYLDWDSLWRRRSATCYFDSWYGYYRGYKAAFLWQAAQDFNEPKSLKSKIVNQLITRELLMLGSPLNSERMMELYGAIKEFGPQLLQSYPGPLTEMAKSMNDAGVKLTVPAITCTAEPLMEWQKSEISKAFGVVPFNWYGAREAGRIASECSARNGMHINTYGLYVEVLNVGKYGGNLGDIVITDLWNTSMPLLRYSIGDVGEIDYSPCACGNASPRLVSVAGRVTDNFINSKGHVIPGVMLANTLVKEGRYVDQIQIIQNSVDSFEFNIVKTEQYGAESEKALVEGFYAIFQDRPSVKINEVGKIPREKSGKVRFCINNIKS